jgi:hypothetical protein
LYEKISQQRATIARFYTPEEFEYLKEEAPRLPPSAGRPTGALDARRLERG